MNKQSFPDSRISTRERGREGEKERGDGAWDTCAERSRSMGHGAWGMGPWALRIVFFSSFFLLPSDFPALHPLHPLQNPLPNFLLL